MKRSVPPILRARGWRRAGIPSWPLLLLAIAPASLPPARPVPGSGTASLVVQVEGLRNERGLLRVSLFRDGEGFPERAELAARSFSVPVTGPSCEVRFEDVETGEWAVAVLHDENENGRLDRSFLRIPKEGVGASNDAARAGSPRFERARFDVPAEGQTLVIQLRYWM